MFSVPLQGDRITNYLQVINEQMNRREHNMALIALRSSRADLYSAVKVATLVEGGIPSQVSRS